VLPPVELDVPPVVVPVDGPVGVTGSAHGGSGCGLRQESLAQPDDKSAARPNEPTIQSQWPRGMHLALARPRPRPKAGREPLT
jgi:hypothetical protein